MPTTWKNVEYLIIWLVRAHYARMHGKTVLIKAHYAYRRKGTVTAEAVDYIV